MNIEMGEKQMGQKQIVDQPAPRWGLRALAVVTAIGVLAGAGELAMRLIIPGVVEGAVRSQLDLSPDDPVDVTLGGSVLLNTIQGGIGDVSIIMPDVPLVDGVEAELDVHADRVPFNPLEGEMRGGTARITVGNDQIAPLVELATQGFAQTGEVRGNELVIGRTVEFQGRQIPLTISLGFEISDGAINLEPARVAVAGFELSSEQVAAATGSRLDPILQPQTLCVRDRLPVGVTLTGVSQSNSDALLIEAKLAPDLMSDPKQRQKGSCAGGAQR
jgi:hypothetical protein